MDTGGSFNDGLNSISDYGETAMWSTATGGVGGMIGGYFSHREQYMRTSKLIQTHEQTKGRNSMSKFAQRIKDDGGIYESIKYVRTNGKYYVVNGNHRVSVAKKLSYKYIRAQRVSLPYLGYSKADDFFWYGRQW